MSNAHRLALVLLATLTVVVAGLSLTSGTPASRAPTLARPIRAAFFYPWFPETWHSDDHFRPTAGRYRSGEAATLDRQMADLRYAGEDAVISSWWGRRTHREQTRFPALMAAASAHGLAVTPYYEKEGSGDTPLPTIRRDLGYLRTYARANPAGFLRVDGTPVIFVYNAAATTSSCAAVAKWKRATHGFTDWYVSLKVFPGFARCAAQPSSWHQYGPALATQAQLPYSYNVSPGFYHHAESAPRLARSLARFEADLAAQVASGARWQLVTSYNEWGEGTSVESATQWATPSGHGAYVDAMRKQYGKQGADPPRLTAHVGAPCLRGRRSR